MKKTFLCLLLALLAATALQAQQHHADWLLVDGTIYTGDLRLGRVEALAIKDGRITAAGNERDPRRWRGPRTRVLNLQGKFVMSAFNDAHLHLDTAREKLTSAQVEGTRSLAEFQQRIRARVKQTPRGEWITGRGWDHTLWKENRVPTRTDLDAVSTRHLIFLYRVDMHSGVANSMALERAGITRATADPPGGAIVRDVQGNATGWLKDRAMDLVTRLIPSPTLEQRKRGLALVLEELARNGIASVHDDSIRYVGWDAFLALRALKEEGGLTARVNAMLPFAAPLEELKRMRGQGGTTDPWLRTGPVKLETDGSGGSLSAAMLEPYATAPDNRGYLQIEPEKLRQMAIERDAAGFQLALHAIGDRAVRVVLDATQAVREANGPSPSPPPNRARPVCSSR